MSSYIIIDSNSNSETYNFNIDPENTIINIPKTIGYTTNWDYSINRKWDIYSNSSLVNNYSNINNDILIGSIFNYNIYYFNDFNDINLQISNLDNQYNNVEYQNYTISIIFNYNTTNINNYSIYYNSDQNGYIFSSINSLTYSNIFYLSNINTIPDQYYIFDLYTIEPNVIINNDSFNMPNSNITITANFIQNDFFIYYNSDQNGYIFSSINSLTYSNIFYLSNINTIPDQYYIFDLYTIEPNVIINNDSFNMPNSNIIITANFNLINYEIQFNSNQNGSIYSSISNLNYQDIFYLSNIEIISNIGYEFNQYTIEPNLNINNDSFIMPNSNITITANFNLINYQIIFSCNNGIITSSINELNYQDIFYLSNITNIPNQYYKFDQYTFSPDVIITNNSFIMPTHNINITGNFIISYYYMNFDLIYATINQNIKQYIEENTTVILPTIIPDPRYEFITWLSDDVSIVNNYFIMPSRDILISNRMERTKSLLTYNLDNGIIEEDTLITSYIIINTEVTLPSVSKYGFIFNSWQSTEFELLNSGDTFNIPDYDITVYALFTFEYNTGVNSIVITKNNLIYTTNTLGAVVNKIDNNFLLTKIAGSDEFSGLDDGFTGNDATFTFPRSIILTNTENELYLIDDNNIRNIKLVSDSIRGESIEIFTNVILTKSIFQNGGFGISKTNQENEICIINYNSRCIINTETLFIENKILITNEEQFIILDSEGTYEIIDIEFNTTDLYTYYNLRFPYYFKNLIANYKSQNNLTFPYYNLISEYPINSNNDELIFYNQIIEIETLDMDKLLNDKDFSISLFFNINQTIINSNIDINNNLIAHYKFDEINTQPEYIFKDETNNNHHLVNGGLNSPILENTEYIFGKSANFINNTDQWVKNDNINLTQSTFSISLWIKTVAHLNNSYIISQGDTAITNRLFYIGIESDDNNNTKYVFNSYNNNFGTQSIFNNDIGNDWVHLVFINNRFSFNNNNRFIYRNGIKISSIYNINDFINSDNDSFNIGTRKDTNGTLQAYLDDLRIYNKVLTDTEIEKLYLMGENKNLLAYYKLNNLIDDTNKLQNLILPDGNIDFYNSTSNIFPVNQWANFTPTISKNFAITPDINKDIPLSFVFWFRYLSLDNYTIISYGDYDNSISSIDFDITNDSKLKISTKLNNLSDQIIISPESPIFINTWYHCVYTLNFSESIITKLYLNGSLKQLLSGYLPSGINTNTLLNYKNLVLGQNCNKTKSFHGNISELYIYNKELSITEINNLYNSYFNKYYTIIDFSNQLIIYYNLNIYNNTSKFIVENNDKIIEYSIPNNNDYKFITYTFKQINDNYDYLIDFYYDTHHIYNNNCNITININTIDDSIFNTSNVIIGKNRNNKYPFNANIKDLRIYQKKLSPLEIKQIYNSKNIEIFEDNKHKYLIFQHIPFNYDTNNLLINYKFNNNLINHIYNNFDLIPLTNNYEFNVYESIINLDNDKFEINQFSNLNDDFTISFKYKYNNMETNNIILTNKDSNIDNDGFDITLYNNILKINTSDSNIDFKIDNIYNSILNEQDDNNNIQRKSINDVYDYIIFKNNGIDQTHYIIDILEDIYCDILVVGGGGGGGNQISGGGGGGAVIYCSQSKLNKGSYSIGVGNGGEEYNKGYISYIHSDIIQIIADGGGTSAQLFGDDSNGSNGGSGGGASADGADGSPYPIGGLKSNISKLIGISGIIYGNNGGDGYIRDGNNIGGGGGGGAGESGQNGNEPASGTYSNGGKGGNGIQIDIIGTTYYWGGGGGGASYNGRAGNGGKGGGGGGAVGDNGDINNIGLGGLEGYNTGLNGGNDGIGGDGAAHTGGGGGGGNWVNCKGGNGGSGIVIIKYKKHINNFNLYTIIFKNLSNTVDFYFNNQHKGNYSNIQLNSTNRNFNIGNLSGHLSDFRIYKNITSNIDIEYNFNNYFTDYTIDFKESLDCDILLIGSGGPSVSITETILTKFDFYSNIIVNYKLESNLNDETSNYNLIDNYLSNETYPSISVLPINLVNNLKNYENINFAFNYNPEFKRSDILYNFKYFQFTSCDKIGYLGPTLEECRNYYNNIYFNNNSYFSNINGYQLWTVPETSYYSIHVYGANSINSNFYQGGKGAYINSEFFLMKDEQLLIVVGQQGSNINSGSGASFVVKGNDYSISTNNDILLIAGGAGGIGNLSTNSFTFEFELLPLSTNLFYVISGNDRNGDIYNMENPYITIFLGDSLKITNNTGGHKFAIGTLDNNIIVDESNSNNIINWTPLETGNFKYWCISHPLHMFSTIYVLEKTKYFEFFDNSYSSINLFSEFIHSETIGKKDIQENLIGGGGGFNYNGEINSNLDTEGKSFINGALGGFPNGGFGGGASSISKTAGGGGGFIGGNSGHFINNYGNKYFNGSSGYSYNNGTLLNFTPAGNYFNFASVIIHKQDIVLFKTIKYNINKLYDFNTYTFTTCGKIGNIGPTLNDCLNYYSNFHYIDNSLIYNYDWIYNENYFNMAQSNNTGYQLWTVPETATYYIEAHGACGGWLEYIYSTSNFQFKGIPGTTIKSEYNLEIGEKIMILVGQSGGLDYNQNLYNINAGGGGGASFVVKSDTFHNLNTTDNVLLVAAGGGGPGTYITDGIFDYSNENTSNISLKTPIKTVLDFANLKFINSFMLSIVLKKQLKIVKNYLRHKLNLPNGLLTGGGILNNGLTKDGIINNGLYTNYLNIYGKAFIYGAIGGGYNQFESNIVNYGGFGGGSSSINKIGGGGGGFIGGNSGIYTNNNNNEHLYFAGSSGYSYSKNNIYQLDINHINNNDIIINQNYITRNYPNGEGKVIITKITNTSNNELRIQVNLNTFLFKIDDTEFHVPYFNSSNSLIWSINSNGNWNFNINNSNINNDIIQPINIDTYDYGIILNNFSINNFLIYDRELTDSEKSVISIELINKTYNLPRYGNQGYTGYFKKISNNIFNGKYDIQISDGGKAHINNSYSVSGNDTFIKNDIFNETLLGAITHDTINYNNNPQINYFQDLINRDLLGSDIFFNNEILHQILNSNLSFSNIGIGGLNSSKFFYDYSDIKGHDASSGLIIIKMDKYSNLPFISIDQKSDKYYINKICKSDFNNIFIENDVKINYQYNIDEILGITFNKNNNDIILTTIIENQYFIMSGYNFDNQYYINNVKESKFKIKTLMDYDIIYNDQNTNYFIGKSSDTDKLYYISYDTLVIDNENPNVISFSEQHEIYDYGTGIPIFVPVKNIIYSNKYITEQHNRLLYFDNINNKILFLNFYTSLYKTTTLKLDYNFVKASKVTINNDDSELYVSEYSNIYSISLINTSLDQNLRTIYNVKQLHQSSNIINALTYKNNRLYYIDNILHSIDNDYLNSNLFNNYINDYSNIQSSIDSEDFNNLTDFVIDANNEIGYLTFESKIKWFYIK